MPSCVLVPGPVQQHDPGPQMGVPMNGRVPERIGVGPMPVGAHGEDRRHMPAEAGLRPVAAVPFG